MQWLTDFLPHSPAAPATVALLATVVLVLGRRGRRINDHPICRRCGFDLVGRPPDSAVCSECGADLRRRRAVRAGARRRVGGAVTAALLLLLPSLGILAFHGWHAYADVPFVQHKPVWWLLNDASSRDAVLRDDAFNELFRRFRSGRLSPPQVRQVAERALEIQGDLRRTWLPQWGDFVEEVQRAKQLPADQWRRFVGQAPQFELVATEQFKRGDRAWLELIERPSRVGAKQDFIVRVHRRLLVADGRGNSFRRNFGAVTYYVGGSSRLQGGWSLPLNEGVIGRLSDGRHEARLEIIVEVLAGREAGILVTTRPSVATVEREFRTAWLVEKATAAESGVAVKDRD